jgi:hypothetical protein
MEYICGTLDSENIMSEKQLTERQKKTLKKHSKHHTARHMQMMSEAMLKGKSFTKAHTEAIKKVGK